MPATEIEKLLVSLEARTKEYEKALAKAQGQTVTQLRKIEREAESFATRFDRKLGAIGASMKAALAGAAVAAVAAFGVAARNAVRDAAAIGDLADKIGTTTDAVQELAYGAVQANMGFEDLSGGLLKFSKALGEARNGAGDLFKILELNGVEKAKIKTLSYSEALEKVADLMKNATNEQDALVIATAAFGRGQADNFLEFLRNGSQGLKDFAKDADNAGAKIDEALIRKAQELDDRWAALMQSMKTKTQSAVLFILDEFSKIGAVDENVMQGRGPPRPRQNRSFLGSTKGAGSVGFSFTPALPVVPSKPTVLPDPDAERKATEAARKKAEADREAARAAKERAEWIKSVQEALDDEWQASTKAAIRITDELNQQILERQEAVRESMRSLAELGLDAFERMAMGGEKLKDVLADVAKALASAALQAAILGQGPLAGLFGSGSGGLLGSLFGNGIATGMTSLYHRGGIVGSGTGMKRAVSPAVFAGAPRMHSGGVAGLRSGEVPAVLQQGEVVLPRGSHMGRGGEGVTIIDQRRNAPPIERSQGPDGKLMLLVRDMAEDAARGVIRNEMPITHGIKPFNRRR